MTVVVLSDSHHFQQLELPNSATIVASVDNVYGCETEVNRHLYVWTRDMVSLIVYAVVCLCDFLLLVSTESEIMMVLGNLAVYVIICLYGFVII